MHKEKYGFIYIWRDRKHNRYYIGSHWGTVNDGYICSSRWMRKSYNRRPKHFRRKIITKIHTNRKDLYEEERRWLGMIKDEEFGKRYYNHGKHILVGDGIPWNKGKKDCFSEETKIKMSKSSKAAWSIPETRKRFIESHMGIKPSEETKRKMSESHKGHIAWNRGISPSEETKEKLSKSLIGHIVLEETKIKIRKANKGYIHSKERNKKISISNTGREHSEEQKRKISESLKGRIPWNKGKQFSEESKRKMSESHRGIHA